MEYVHGYSDQEHLRLGAQAATLTELLHADTRYPAGSRVLEAGCGVGAQTVILAANSPGADLTCVEISAASIAAARARVTRSGLANTRFVRADLFEAPFPAACFDHVFVCFVLEHLADPVGALRALRRLLRPGGSVTVIEGDHGSAYFHPDSEPARRAIGCLIDLQARAGGDALIGRRLYPLLVQAGYRDVAVSPRVVYADASRPNLVEGFTRRTFTAMVEGVGEQAVGAALLDAPTWAAGIEALHRTTEPDGTFSYTFFKATATSPAA
jgi:SAM-dependent methyltransferase